jgi:hypothetical protein
MVEAGYSLTSYMYTSILVWLYIVYCIVLEVLIVASIVLLMIYFGQKNAKIIDPTWTDRICNLNI